MFLVALSLLFGKHIGPKYDVKPREALDRFGIEFSKSHDLEFLNSGVGKLADSKEGIWALSLVSRKKMELDEAKVLAMELARELIGKMRSDPLFINYCNVAQKGVVKDTYCAFKIAFWDEEMNRPAPPHVSLIRLADGKLYFHFADPKTQALNEEICLTLE